MIRRNTHEFTEEDWREKAACLNVDPSKFFPFSEADQAEIAAMVCGSCVVRSECLDFALATRQEYGVWGGATEKERKLAIKAYVRNRKQA